MVDTFDIAMERCNEIKKIIKNAQTNNKKHAPEASLAQLKMALNQALQLAKAIEELKESVNK